MHTYSHNPIFHLFCLFFLLLLGPTLSNSRNIIPLPQSRPSAHHNSNLTQYHNQLINLFEEEEENDTNTNTTTNINTTPTSFNPFTLQDYVLMLKQNSFFGTWSSLDSVSRPFEEFFTNPAGLLIIEALDSDKTQVGGYSAHMVRNFNVTTNLFTGLRHFSTAQSYTSDYNTWTLLIKMYDGAYVDQNSANVFYQVTPNAPISFDLSNTTLFISDSTINVYLKDGNGDGRLYRQCAANFSLYFADKSSLQPFLQVDKGNSNVGIFFELTSSECNISVGSGIMTIDGFADSYQINLYTLVASTIALIQIIGAYKLRCQIRNRKMAFRVAAGSVWLIATVDYYMLIMNLVLIFSYSLKFTVPLLLYVLLTFYIERDIIVQVLKAQSKRSELEISDENCRSCGFHFGLSTLMFVFELIFILMSKLWVIHFTALVFIPQIVYNAKKARPYVFNFYQVFLMGVPHIAFIAYLKLYPDNIFKLHPDMTFVLIYASIMTGQILILIAQTVTPLACLFCLSKKRKKSRVLEEDDVCPICMGDLKVHASQTATDRALLDCEETIETPCSHVFHTECLRKWLKTKVECPVCRENVEELLEEVTVSSEEDGQRQMPEPELGPLML